mmetsp:Transcript_602/g.1415  ORF Transcript_602/g.1415 Transcript_602/m.1415 type:complete len:343 (-) Transcript_602:1178-2206(-)
MALAPVRCWEPARLQLHGGADCAAPHWDLQPGAAEGSSCAASSGGEESGSLGFGFSPPGGAADGAGEETGGAAGPASLAGRNTDRQRGRRGRRGRSRGRSRARHANAWARESPCATTDPQAAQGDEGFPDGEQQHRGAGGRGQASGCSERGKSPSARDLVNSQREQGAEEASPKRPRVRAASDSAYGPQKGRTQAGSSPRWALPTSPRPNSVSVCVSVPLCCAAVPCARRRDPSFAKFMPVPHPRGKGLPEFGKHGLGKRGGFLVWPCPALPCPPEQPLPSRPRNMSAELISLAHSAFALPRSAQRSAPAINGAAFALSCPVGSTPLRPLLPCNTGESLVLL